MIGSLWSEEMAEGKIIMGERAAGPSSCRSAIVRPKH
jgi:hypothetical protein